MEIKALKFLLPQPRKCTEFNFSQCKLKFSILAILRCRLYLRMARMENIKTSQKMGSCFQISTYVQRIPKIPKILILIAFLCKIQSMSSFWILRNVVFSFNFQHVMT